jgi:hypothetical protein
MSEEKTFRPIQPSPHVEECLRLRALMVAEILHYYCPRPAVADSEMLREAGAKLASFLGKGTR